MHKRQFTRRRFMAATTAASATMLAAPFVRTAHAAGRLSIGFWDHWVPGANDTTRALVEQWAEKYPAGAPPQADAWTLEGPSRAFSRPRRPVTRPAYPSA